MEACISAQGRALLKGMIYCVRKELGKVLKIGGKGHRELVGEDWMSQVGCSAQHPSTHNPSMPSVPLVPYLLQHTSGKTNTERLLHLFSKSVVWLTRSRNSMLRGIELHYAK